MTRKTESQKIALCGVLAALSVALMLVGEILQLATYVAPLLAGLLILPPLEEYGKKYALLQYLTVSLLAGILVPELEMVFFYAFLVGYYPVLKKLLDRLRPALLRRTAKLVVFCAAIVAMYAVLIWFFMPQMWQELQQEGLWLTALMGFLMLFTLAMYDVILMRFTLLYHYRLRNKLKGIL